MRLVLVAVKSVPVGGGELRIVDAGLTRDGVSHGIDPLNEVSLEWALRARELGVVDRVVAVAMGPASASDALRQAIALGADEAVLVSDPTLVGADVRTTGRVLAAVASRLSAWAVVTGYESADSSSGAVPAVIAAALGWPLLSRVGDAQLDAAGLRAMRDLGGGPETVRVEGRFVMSMVEGHIAARYPKLKAVMAARNAPLIAWTATDLEVAATTPALRSESLREVTQPAKHARVLSFDDGVTYLAAVLTGRTADV